MLILVPNPLVSQWQEELSSKFHLDFRIAPRTATSSRDEFWATHDRVLVSTSFARTGRRPQAIASAQWDLVIVDEAHHCRNRATKLWKLVNSLQRRHMFLLTATPVQNNLVELYSLLTLLEPGHLKTEADFKKQFVTRGNPRDPRNRHRLRELLGEVMIRNTRGLVQINLPPRYAQTIIATPGEEESQLLIDIQQYLRDQLATEANPNTDDAEQECPEELDASSSESTDTPNAVGWDQRLISRAGPPESTSPAGGPVFALLAGSTLQEPQHNGPAGISRMRLHAILTSIGSHPATAAATLQPLAERDDRARQLC